MTAVFFSSSGIFEPSVAQPPLPLQEFLPLQPLSPDLQPPLPLQEFWPLQACLFLHLLLRLLLCVLSGSGSLPPGGQIGSLNAGAGAREQARDRRTRLVGTDSILSFSPRPS